MGQFKKTMGLSYPPTGDAMKTWTFWDWLTYVGIWLAAIIAALDAGLKNAPSLAATMPDFGSWPIWPFIPLLLLLASGLIFAVRLFAKPVSKKYPQWPDSYAPDEIISKDFLNEHVVLDGHRYIRCRFENCTYVYNGTTAIQMSGCAFSGSIIFKSDNPAVVGAFALMYAFKNKVADLSVKLENSNSTLEPISPQEPQSPQGSKRDQ